MNRRSSWLRRVELTFWVLAFSLLATVLGATIHRSRYQAEQERVLESRMAAMHPAPALIPATPSPSSATETPPPHVEIAAPSDVPLTQERPPKPDVPPPARTLENSHPRRRAPVKIETRALETDADPDLLGRIEIPRIGLKAIVRKGDDEETLDRAVGWIDGTARPGEGGNTALAGHRDTFFRPLERVRVNDHIRLVVPPNTYEYRVDSLSVVTPAEVSVLQSSGTEELTLVTCHPFRWIGPAPDRFVVRATRIQ